MRNDNDLLSVLLNHDDCASFPVHRSFWAFSCTFYLGPCHNRTSLPEFDVDSVREPSFKKMPVVSGHDYSACPQLRHLSSTFYSGKTRLHRARDLQEDVSCLDMTSERLGVLVNQLRALMNYNELQFDLLRSIGLEAGPLHITSTRRFRNTLSINQCHGRIIQTTNYFSIATHFPLLSSTAVIHWSDHGFGQ